MKHVVFHLSVLTFCKHCHNKSCILCIYRPLCLAKSSQFLFLARELKLLNGLIKEEEQWWMSRLNRMCTSLLSVMV